MEALIARLEQLGDVSRDEIAAMNDMAHRPRRYERGAVLRRCEEPSGTVFCITRGWAMRCRLLADGQRQILSILIPGDVCGLQALAGACNDHHIVALTDLEVEECAASAFEALLSQHGDLARLFLRGRVQDESLLREQVVRLGRRRARERVLHLIIELCERQRLNGDPYPERLAHPLNRETLADTLGLSPVHVSRSLAALAVAGIIRHQRGCITLIDAERGAQSCGYDETYLLGRRAGAAGDADGLHKAAQA